MPDYKCCLLDASEMVMAVEPIQCEDDVRAMVLAAHLIVRKYPGSDAVEVWDESHRIGRIANPKRRAAKALQI
jgi:hypothetical protein